uniref:SHSP domain-containing protein n=1 Tax=Electrophorus electricus TaxID=8005 RepID=A0A4W4DMW5_ELEEL
MFRQYPSSLRSSCSELWRRCQGRERGPLHLLLFIFVYFHFNLTSLFIASSGRPASMGVVQTAGETYYLSADVGYFEPHDIVVMAYNHCIVIHAEKVGSDGCVRNKFSHRSVLPEDMDPLSVSGTLTPEGMLVISVKRTCTPPMTSVTSCPPL